MRKQNLLYGLYLVALLLLAGTPVWGKDTPEPENPSLITEQINGCAGVDTEAAFCTFCDQSELELNFLNVLNGNPRDGGVWTDLDASGLNISDPTSVDIAGLGTGAYRFRYNVNAGNGCPADQAVLTLNITGANTVACVDQVNVLLQDDCTYQLTVNQVLSGATLCDDQLEVLVFDVESNFYGNVLGVDQVDKILDVVVFEQGCPNPVCTSTVLVEDKGIPNLNTIDWLPDDITLYCHDLDYFVNDSRTWLDPDYKYYLGGPIINDCSGFQVSVTDRVVYLDCGPVSAELHRTFIITDASGNIASTTLVAEFLYPRPDLISKFDDIVINDCTPEDAIVPDTYPFIINHFGDTLYLREDGCNYSIGFEDREFLVCGGSLKIEREIRFFDWCEDRFFPIDTLVIKIGDFQAPFIQNNVDTAEVAVSPFQCTATLSIHEADLERILSIEIEDCNDAEISTTGRIESYLPNPNFIDSSFQTGSAINTGFYINNIPIGLHRLILTLSDACKSEGLDTVYFRVVDQTAPIMSCDDRLLVAMSEGPYAQITFSDIDEGSQDNCSLSQLKIRRQVAPEAYTFFDYNNNGRVLGDELDLDGFTRFDDQRTKGNYVEYFCSDLENPQQTVELWGWDRQGNSSNCWSNILLEDKIPPACRAPKDTVVACYDFQLNQLDLLGMAEPVGTNCGGILIEALPTLEEINQCGAGSLVRRFQAIKNQGTNRELVGPICVQTITIENIQDYHICFPADVVSDCESDPDLTGPRISNNACALFAEYQEDVRLQTVNEGCYKILRTYEIINWCEYDGISPAIVIGRDVDEDQVPGDEDICVLVRPNGLSYLDRNTLETDTIPNLKGYWINSQERSALGSTGFWKYTQHIKIVDETAPEFSFTEDLKFPSRALSAEGTCFGIVEVPFSMVETCNTYLSFQLALDAFRQGDTPIPLTNSHLTGSYPNFTISGDFPIGKHQFVVEANDGCGNKSQVRIPFEVQDEKAPAPICADVIRVNMSLLEQGGELIPQASVDVQAFVESPIFDCTGQGEGGLVTDFSINRRDSTALRDQRFLYLDCNDLNEYVPVEIHAWDEAGNHGFCETFIEVQDNQSLCEEASSTGDGVIQGVIQMANGQMVENVQIDLFGENTGLVASKGDGSFSFGALKEGEQYTLVPNKNDDFRNGVSTLDLILIQKHILGATFINDPFRMIAADINNSRSISTLDLIQLRKLILNIDDRFANNTSWRFIEANYVFPNPQNPWAETFPEEAIIEEVKALNEVAFIALKVGDVNASARPNGLAGNTDPRTQATQYLSTNEIAMQRGASYSVPIRILDLKQMEGLQGTFTFDPTLLDLLDIDYGLLSPAQVGMVIDEGQLTFSWNKTDLLLGENSTLITLRFQAVENVFLSRTLALNSSLTEAEAYTAFAEKTDLVLQFKEDGIGQKHYELGQSYPNPFRNQTIFPYTVGKTGTTHFEIINTQGQIIWKQNISNVPGQHQLEIPANILPSKGLYQLRMRQEDQWLHRSFIYH